MARREHSCQELRQKLGARGHSQRVIDPVLTQLQQSDLLSDQRFAEMFCRNRIDKGYGPLRIVQELRQKGLDDAEANRALEAMPVDWYERACQTRRKKFSNELPIEIKQRAKQWRFLHYRGFDADQINHALSEKS